MKTLDPSVIYTLSRKFSKWEIYAIDYCIANFTSFKDNSININHQDFADHYSHYHMVEMEAKDILLLAKCNLCTHNMDSSARSARWVVNYPDGENETLLTFSDLAMCFIETLSEHGALLSDVNALKTEMSVLFYLHCSKDLMSTSPGNTLESVMIIEDIRDKLGLNNGYIKSSSMLTQTWHLLRGFQVVLKDINKRTSLEITYSKLGSNGEHKRNSKVQALLLKMEREVDSTRLL